MKCKPLTLDVINNLDKDSILYAEFSESGAMGACGTARIFVLDDGILQFYLVSVFDGKSDKRKKELNDIYAAVYGFLSSLTKQKILIEKYAGYGNTAWKRRGITFTRDDDHSIFLYKKSKQVYHIPASNPGVYHKVVADFAERQVEVKAIKKYFDAQKKKLSIAEQDFFDAYLNQLEENDHHLGIFQFTVAEYWDAICLLKLRNLQDFNLSSDAIRDGEKAIATFGEISPVVLKEFEIKNPVCFFELFTDTLPEAKQKHEQFIENPIQPIVRDIAFVVDETITANQLVSAFKDNMLTDIKIVDIYKMPLVGQKSVALRYIFEPKENITTEQVNAMMDKIIKAVETKTGGKVRDGR